jgi:hypothetical protein
MNVRDLTDAELIDIILEGKDSELPAPALALGVVDDEA